MAAAVETKFKRPAVPKIADNYRRITAFVSCAAPAALIVLVLTLLQQALPAIPITDPPSWCARFGIR